MTHQATPRVAVVMRTKNRPALLDRALESVAGQTYDDFSLVVVNDGGDEGLVTSQLATLPEALRARTKVVTNATSSGREAAMNDGVHATQSEFIVIHDDDDTWEPHFLERTVAFLDSHPDDDAVATRTAIVYEHAASDGTLIVDRTEIFAADQSAVTLSQVLMHNFTPPISLLYRRSVHDEIGEYDGDLPVLADWEFLLRLLSRGSVGFIDGEPLANWHHRTAATGDLGNSVIAAADDHARYDGVIRDRVLRSELRERGGLGPLLIIAAQLDRICTHVSADGDHTRSIALHVDNKLHSLVTTHDSRMHEQNAEIRALGAAVHDLSRNLASQTNRLVAQFDHLNQRVTELEQLTMSQTPRERARSYGRLARRMLGRITSTR